MKNITLKDCLSQVAYHSFVFQKTEIETRSVQLSDREKVQIKYEEKARKLFIRFREKEAKLEGGNMLKSSPELTNLRERHRKDLDKLETEYNEALAKVERKTQKKTEVLRGKINQ